LLKFLPRVEGCFNGAATATGCTVKLTQSFMFCDVKYNEELSLIYVKHMEKLGAVFPSRQIQESAPRGSTDMGNVSYETASIHPVFDIGVKADIHTTSFREAASTEEAHLNAMRVIKALALTGIDCVVDGKIYGRVRKEFDERS
jgi:metal-dependent amidase/aminoacylase/carboxypeptidase family protein